MNNKDLFKDANQRATTHCRHRTQTPPTATAEATTGREGQAIISKAIGEGRENMTELEAFYPALTLTRPISTMHTAKTQIVRQPQRNRCLLRPIAYYWQYRPAGTALSQPSASSRG